MKNPGNVKDQEFYDNQLICLVDKDCQPSVISLTHTFIFVSNPTPWDLLDSYNVSYYDPQVYRPPPPEISLSVCCEYVEGLPAVDAPELFGMDHNADTAFLANQGRALIGDLLSAQPRLTAAAVG